jgi:hypothetical protein
MQRDPRKLVFLAIVLVVAVAAGVAVASGLRGDSPSTDASGLSAPVTAESLDVAVQGLCEVRSDLENDDSHAARTVFYDKSHLFLHQLAAAVQVKDRDRATSLLIAKYRVEDLMPASGQPQATSDTDPPLLITQLLQEVGASAALLGMSAPDCQ